MNQRYENNDRNRNRYGDDMQDKSRSQYRGQQGGGRQPEGNYEGDWGGQGGNLGRGNQYGYAEPRGRQYDSDGWGESHSSMSGQRRAGRDYVDRSYGDPRDYGPREWAARGRGSEQEQAYGSQDFGTEQDYPSQRGYGDQSYGRGDYSMSPESYGYRSQGYGDRNYDSPGYGRGYGGRHGGGLPNVGSQGFQQGRESFDQSHSGSGQQQSFRGKGPKGYKRSDERLLEDISERLMDDAAIDASDISVQCRDGVVTLEGTVGERRLKHRIEDVVERCNGVKDIENRIRVTGRGGHDESPDSEGKDSGAANRSSEGSGNQNQKKKQH